MPTSESRAGAIPVQPAMLEGQQAQTEFTRRPWPVRSLLNWLVLACLLPGIIGASALVIYECREARAQLERDVLQTVRALVQAVDNHLLKVQAVAQSLSTSDALARRDFAVFHRQAREVVALAGLATNIVLRDEGGRQILNTAVDFGQPLSPLAAPDQVRGVFETGRPTIADLFVVPVLKRPIMSVDVPVMREGRVAYALGIGVLPEHFTSILRNQGLQPGWVAGVFDRTGTLVGRSNSPERLVGQKASAKLLQQMRESGEGSVAVTTAEGIPVLSFYSRSPVTGWGVAIGIPRDSLEARLTHTLALLLLGVASLFAIGLGLAWLMGRKVTHAFGALAASALALAKGESVSLPSVDVREAAEMAGAMANAAGLLRERAVALQARETELAARSAALRQSEIRLQTLTQHAPAAIAVFDRDMRYLAVSQRWRDDYRLGDRNMIGICHYEAFPDIPPEWREAHRRGLAGEVLRSEADRFERTDGTAQWVRWQIWPWRDDTGAVGGVVIAAEDITERMEALEALRRSRELLRLITDAVPALISYVDAEYRYRLVNEGYQRWFGIPPEGIIGRQVWEVLGDAVWEKVQPWIARALAGETISYQEELPYREGGPRWMSLSYTPDLEKDGRVRGIVVMAVDVTDRVQAERALRDREEKLGAIVSHSPSALSLKYPDGRYALANPNVQRILHRSEAEIIDKSDFDLYPAETARAFRANDERVLATLARHSIEETVPVDGLPRLYMSHIFPVLRADGSAQYICRISLDITDRKRADEEISRLNADLERQVAARTAELQRSNEALLRSNMELQNFAHAAAHDLQTPLRSIAGFAQLVRERVQERGDGQATEWLGYVIDNTKRLQALILELLAYSRLDALARPFEPVDLREVFEQVAATPAATVSEAGAEVSCGDLPTLMADRSQLVQLLQNLIENGIKYNRSGRPQVRVSCERRGNEWVFAVADNGIGIDPRHHERIFQIFRRLHTHDHIPGTGIGLAICRRIVERHGGRIWVESKSGEGSVFYFSLPARGVESGPSRAAVQG